MVPVGYVNPDDTTFEYIKGRPYAPKDEDWDNAVETWRSFASDDGCEYDDVVLIDASDVPNRYLGDKSWSGNWSG